MNEFESQEKINEKSILLRKMFESRMLLKIGKELGDSYCNQFNEQGHDANYKYFNEDEVGSNIAKIITDQQLLEFSRKYRENLQSYWSFIGKYYTYYSERKEVKLESLWSNIRAGLEEVYKKHDKAAYAVLKAYLECRKDWKIWSDCDYNSLAYRSKEMGGKGWKEALTALELVGIISKRGSGKHPGERSIPLELMPSIEEVVKDWEKRPSPIAEKPVKIDRHKIIEDLIAAYPFEIFGEKLVFFKKPFKLSSGDSIDLIFQDSGGKHLIVDVKTVYNEAAIGQLLRYKDEYSIESSISKENIRIAIVCPKEISEKFLKAAKGAGIEICHLKITGEKI